MLDLTPRQLWLFYERAQWSEHQARADRIEDGALSRIGKAAYKAINKLRGTRDLEIE